MQLKRWIETTIITFEDHNIRRQIRTLVPTAPDSPLGPRRPTCPCWRLTQVSFSCFLRDYIIIHNFLHTFWSGSMHWYVSVWLTFCPFSPGWPGSPGNPLTPCIYTNNPISMNSPCKVFIIPWMEVSPCPFFIHHNYCCSYLALNYKCSVCRIDHIPFVSSEIDCVVTINNTIFQVILYERRKTTAYRRSWVSWFSWSSCRSRSSLSRKCEIKTI